MIARIVSLCAAVFCVAVHAQAPIVIAHRGASGYLPEHTLEAYALAYGMGADYIEPDLVLTKDNRFICLHDIHLEATTDVEERFPERAREDGQWYAADFTLDEIKTLRVHERIENRFPVGKSEFRVPTFEEMIELIQGMNTVTGRTVGIYPEIKAPKWHEDEGLPMEARLLEVLTVYGYTTQDSAVYVQCFEPPALEKIRNELGSDLKLIQLISDDERQALLRTEDGIEYIAGYADGIGPNKMDLYLNPALAIWAKIRGLQVHPYTLRADDVAEGMDSFEAELEKIFENIGADGAFTDHPDVVRDFVSERFSTNAGE